MNPYLTHLLTLSNAATEGPWARRGNGVRFQNGFGYRCIMPRGEAACCTSQQRNQEQREANAAFIAEARTAVPRLVEMVRVQQEALLLAQHWLANCAPVVQLDGPKPLPLISAALARVEQLAKGAQP